MLERISIKNFQSLKDVVVELGKFTVLCGESETGKSAFIRACQKLTTNSAVIGTANGETWSAITPGAKNVDVKFDLDGHCISWRKGDVNAYRVDGTALTKVGRECPDEVQQLLRMGEVVFDDKTRYHLNFQTQFELPFLVDENGNKVAKILGDLTNVNLLLAATREANRQKLSVNRASTTEKERVEELRVKLQEYRWVIQSESVIKVLVKTKDEVYIAIHEIGELQSLTTKIIEALQRSREAKERSLRLASVIDVGAKLVTKIDETERILSAIKTVANRLVEAVTLKSNAETRRYVANLKVDESVTVLESFIKDNPTCPLCGQNLTAKHAHNIVGK